MPDVISREECGACMEPRYRHQSLHCRAVVPDVISREECEAYIDRVWVWLEGLGTGALKDQSITAPDQRLPMITLSVAVLAAVLVRALAKPVAVSDPRTRPKGAAILGLRQRTGEGQWSRCIRTYSDILFAMHLQASSGTMRRRGTTPAGRQSSSIRASSTAWRCTCNLLRLFIPRGSCFSCIVDAEHPQCRFCVCNLTPQARRMSRY